MKKCKECLMEKESEEFYKHPLTKDWLQWRCRNCILKWRHTEKELEMARKRDYDRYHNPDNKRRMYVLKNYRKYNPREKILARQLVYKEFLKNRSIVPEKCPITWLPVECLHHFDYSKPLEVIPCSIRWHWRLHSKNPPEIKEEWIIRF